MPKLKTHKGAKRRFRITATGQLTRRRSGRRHLLTGKSGKKGRHLRRPAKVASVFVEKLHQLLPYS